MLVADGSLHRGVGRSSRDSDREHTGSELVVPAKVGRGDTEDYRIRNGFEEAERGARGEGGSASGRDAWEKEGEADKRKYFERERRTRQKSMSEFLSVSALIEETHEADDSSDSINGRGQDGEEHHADAADKERKGRIDVPVEVWGLSFFPQSGKEGGGTHLRYRTPTKRPTVNAAWQPENKLDPVAAEYAGEIPGCSVK